MAITPTAPSIKERIYCPGCMKTKSEDDFYTFKDGTKSNKCKICETMYINNWEPDTFLPLLERYDVPYIPSEWNVLRDRAYAKDPNKVGPMSVFGKYLSKMKLKQYAYDKTTGLPIGWKDTERFMAEDEEKARQYKEMKEQQAETMKQNFEEGVITEEQYNSYLEQNKEEEHFEVGLAPGGGKEIYIAGNAPFEKVDLVDVGADLTQEDKIYLAMKWGQLYTAAEWVALEQKYNEFKDSFDIQDAAREDQLMFICKTSLKMHQALDTGDVESYQKLSRVYDAQMKAAKFTEAQKKEEKASEFNCFGKIVAFVEEHTEDFIKPIDLTVDRDIVDRDIRDIKNYTKSLIEDDPAVFKMIEQYIKKREILAEQEQDKEGLDEYEVYELTDEDLRNYQKSIEEQREENDLDEEDD